MMKAEGGGEYLAPHLELETLTLLLVELVTEVGEGLLRHIERIRFFLDHLQLLDA